ncbi:FAD-dependent thymidylate synthase [Helicobacter muridarum]|uniref:Flavin-dependent thymidylate synthase n=1 Tax=Helicobacter muridarum TaxID=216 RepID=A0A099U022_9HELI|nr:FAD-dependent thymidylate synthase [Helicobacter muridarum]TLE00759.1 FAD-dependent thymidylate synthase [Helicobacter muridarum]STQ86561.1 FAD-dependent thymidylate synthase [Helicobacter muridarum]
MQISTYTKQHNVELKHYTPLELCSYAIRTCWNSHDKSSKEADKELIYRVGNKLKHASTLEHIVYHFHIKGISRACLQELARHRIASLSVKSTRYTLKELKKRTLDIDNLGDFVVLVPNDDVNLANLNALQKMQELLKKGIVIDIVKYMIPESYKTELSLTINARSLQNFLALRSSKRALWEIRILSWSIYESLPDSHKYLFYDSMEIT